MPVRKIAISVPEEVLRQVDRLARKSNITRSGLITRILREVSDASSRAEVTERINQLFSDQDIAAEQLSVSHAFLQAAETGEDPEW